jgi:hypothetical protein
VPDSAHKQMKIMLIKALYENSSRLLNCDFCTLNIARIDKYCNIGKITNWEFLFAVREWVGWVKDGQIYKKEKYKSICFSAVQLFRKRDWTSKNRKIFFSFLKKSGAHKFKINVEKIFLFWDANFEKVCGRKQCRLKTFFKSFLQKKFELRSIKIPKKKEAFKASFLYIDYFLFLC